MFPVITPFFQVFVKVKAFRHRISALCKDALVQNITNINWNLNYISESC